MPEFFDHYGSEVQCTQAVERMCWPQGFAAPAAVRAITAASVVASVISSSAIHVASRLR